MLLMLVIHYQKEKNNGDNKVPVQDLLNNAPDKIEKVDNHAKP